MKNVIDLVGDHHSSSEHDENPVPLTNSCPFDTNLLHHPNTDIEIDHDANTKPYLSTKPKKAEPLWASRLDFYVQLITHGLSIKDEVAINSALLKAAQVVGEGNKLPESIVRKVETLFINDEPIYQAVHEKLLDLFLSIIDSASYVKLKAETIEQLGKDLSSSSLQLKAFLALEKLSSKNKEILSDQFVFTKLREMQKNSGGTTLSSSMHTSSPSSSSSSYVLPDSSPSSSSLSTESTLSKGSSDLDSELPEKLPTKKSDSAVDSVSDTFVSTKPLTDQTLEPSLFEHGVKDVPTILKEIREDQYNIDNADFNRLLSSGYLEKTLHEIDEITKAKDISNWVEKDINDYIKEFRLELLTAPDKATFVKENLPEALAVVNKAVELKTKYKLRSAQMISVLSLCSSEDHGRLLQIATGEGKSTTTAVTALIKALSGEKVDIVTSSEVLAKRDAEYWKDFFALFGISCDHNISDPPKKGPKPCYYSNIVYGNAISFQGDILRDEYKGLGTRGDRKISDSCVLIDEVDNMLIDESSKIAKLSSPLPAMEYLTPLFVAIWVQALQLICYYTGGHELEEIDTGDEGIHIPKVTFGVKNLETLYKNPKLLAEVEKQLTSYIKQLITFEGELEKIVLPKHLQEFALYQADKWANSALNAFLMQEKKDYLITQQDGKDVIAPIDYANTGIIQLNTTLSHGIQQFLQIKHKLKISSEGLTTCYLSNVGFFNYYGKKIYGMTGTLGSKDEQGLLGKVYGIDFVFMPTFKQKHFDEFSGVIAQGKEAWQAEIIKDNREIVQKGKAVLIILETIYEAEQIHQAFISSGYNPEKLKLYTRSDDKKAVEAVEQEVTPGDIIIATNLAGRGTDIKTSKGVEEAGGLHVCLTFLPSNIRVEKQAFGRTSRQGNEGSGGLIIDGELICQKFKLDSVQTAEIIQTQDITKLKIIRDALEARRLRVVEESRLKKILEEDKLFDEFKKFAKELQLDPSHTEYKSEQLEELWGVWLNQLDYFGNDKTAKITKDNLWQEFEIFKQEARKVYVDKNKIMKNTAYLTRYANNNLGKEGNYDLSISLYDAAIELDPVYSFAAHYNKAYANIRKNPDHKNIQGLVNTARQELHHTLNAIEGTIIPQWYMTLMLLGEEYKESALTKQISKKIDLLKVVSDHSQKALELIHAKGDGDKIILIKDSESSNIFQVMNVDSKGISKEDNVKAEEVIEIATFGILDIFTLEAKDPPRSFLDGLAMAFLGIGQFVLGALVTVCTLGTASEFGIPMLIEGAKDIYHGVRALQGKENIDWGSYWISKGVSYAASCLSMGWGNFKEGLKALKEQVVNVATATKNFCGNITANLLGQEAAKETAKITFTSIADNFINKEVIKVVARDLAIELTKSVAIEYATDFAVKEIAGHFGNVKEDMATKAKQRVIDRLSQEPSNSQLTHLVLLDIATHKNFYQKEILTSAAIAVSKQQANILSIASPLLSSAVSNATRNSHVAVRISANIATKLPTVFETMQMMSSLIDDMCLEIVNQIAIKDQEASKARSSGRLDEVLEGKLLGHPIAWKKADRLDINTIVQTLKAHEVLTKEGDINEELVQSSSGIIVDPDITRPMGLPEVPTNPLDELNGRKTKPSTSEIIIFQQENWKNRTGRQHIEQIDFGPYRHFRDEIISSTRFVAEEEARARALEHDPVIIAHKEAFAANVGEVVAGRTMELIKNGFIKPIAAPIVSFGVGELSGYMKDKMSSFAEIHPVAAGDVPYDETNPMHKGKGKLKDKEPAGPTGACTGPAKPKPSSELTQEDIDFWLAYKPPTFGSSSSSNKGKSREEVLGLVVPHSPYSDSTTGRASGIGISLIPEAYGSTGALASDVSVIDLSFLPMYEAAAGVGARGLLGMASSVLSSSVAGVGAIIAAGCYAEKATYEFYQKYPELDPDIPLPGSWEDKALQAVKNAVAIKAATTPSIAKTKIGQASLASSSPTPLQAKALQLIPKSQIPSVIDKMILKSLDTEFGEATKPKMLFTLIDDEKPGSFITRDDREKLRKLTTLPGFSFPDLDIPSTEIFPDDGGKFRKFGTLPGFEIPKISGVDDMLKESFPTHEQKLEDFVNFSYDIKHWDVKPASVKEAPEVYQHGKFGKIYKDPEQTVGNKEIWWSKDTAKHGGASENLPPSAYKLFVKSKTEFTWIADADETGKIIEGKTKGEVGEEIKVKECWKVK